MQSIIGNLIELAKLQLRSYKCNEIVIVLSDGCNKSTQLKLIYEEINMIT